jgi:hypothetical protein
MVHAKAADIRRGGSMAVTPRNIDGAAAGDNDSVMQPHLDDSPRQRLPGAPASSANKVLTELQRET